MSERVYAEVVEKVRREKPELCDRGSRYYPVDFYREVFRRADEMYRSGQVPEDVRRIAFEQSRETCEMYKWTEG